MRDKISYPYKAQNNILVLIECGTLIYISSCRIQKDRQALSPKYMKFNFNFTKSIISILALRKQKVIQ